MTLTVIPGAGDVLLPERRQELGQSGAGLGLPDGTRAILRVTLPRSGVSSLSPLRSWSARLALAATLGSEFLPQLDEGVIWVRANLPPGTSLSQSPSEIANDMSGLIRQSTEIEGGRCTDRAQRFGHRSVRPEPERTADHAQAL